MIVPNYVPEPLEVPGNVADEPYRMRLAFIRRVTLLHLGSIATVGGLGELPWPSIGPGIVLGALGAVLILLDIWRIRWRGHRIEATVSAALLPFPMILASWAAHEGMRRGWPVMALVAGLSCAAAYTLLCGRDFSFVGCTCLSLICSTVALAGLAVLYGYSASQAGAALAANAAYVVYFEYDLASLLSRRRRSEELAAIVDLYRDVFNIFGYALRLLRHWRKHRIWA